MTSINLMRASPLKTRLKAKISQTKTEMKMTAAQAEQRRYSEAADVG